MVIQNTPTKIDKIASLRIGQRGENLATDIKMDVSDWIAVHPDANYYCLFKRPDEVQVQPVLSSLEEDVLTWTVRAWECAVIGVGYLEVRAVNPDTGLVAKSRVIPCAIEDSVIDDEGPVPPEMTWVGEVLAAKNTAVAAKTAAEEARDTAQTTVNGAIAGIQAEGQMQVGVVQAEGTTQVGAVQSEGTTQVGAVQAKGTEVLNSIPSDYTELSDDVTGLKSALSSLQDNTVIKLETDPAYAYTSAQMVEYGESSKIRITGNPGDVVVYALGESILPVLDAFTKSGDQYSVSTDEGQKFSINGSIETAFAYNGEQNDSIVIDNRLSFSQNDKIHLGLYISGEITGNAGWIKQILRFRLDDDTNTDFSTDSSTGGWINLPVSEGLHVYEFTVPSLSSTINSLRHIINFKASRSYANVDFYIAYVKNAAYVSAIIPESGVLEIDGAQAQNGITVLTHKASVFYTKKTKKYIDKAIEETKEYVDNHVPDDMLTESDLVYLTPEMFGALGDGVADDTVAVQTCIDEALANKSVVRGFGAYRLTSGVTIQGDPSSYTSDVFLNRVTFEGSGSAVNIYGLGNRFKCNIISAYANTECTSVIKLYCNGGVTCYNIVDVTMLFAYNNGFEFDTNGYNIFYNIVRCSRIISRYANCLYLHITNGGLINENDFYLKSLSCNNGYVAYIPSGGNNSNRIYNAGIESSCANGVYGEIKLIHPRTTECMDLKQNDLTKGYIFKIPSGLPGHVISCEEGNIDIEAVDLTEADSYEDRIQFLIDKYVGGSTKYLSYDMAFPNANYLVSNCYRYVCSNTGHYPDYEIKLKIGKLLIYYNHKGFVPDTPTSRTITESDFYTEKRAFPTRMVLQTNSTIHLDYSYCCVGINEFYVHQESGYKAIIYDKNNNLLFDGTNKDDGIYKFSCSFRRLDSLTVPLPNGSSLVYTTSELNFLYTGDNEVWTIEKLNIVT